MLLVLIFLFLQLSLTSAVSCPAGGVYDNNFQRCYIYYSQPTVFLEAESTCRSIGGNLAEIRNGFVNVVTNNNPPPTYWIGANLLLSSKWTWTTNETALYTNWAADEPQDPSMFQCASVRDDSFLWNKELCSSARPFVCTANLIPDPSTSPCDPGYTFYEKQCFRLFSNFVDRLNFHDSKIFCRDHQNATLPIITSVGMQNFLEGFIFDSQSDIWLALTCCGTDPIASCMWSNGKNPGYTNYYPGSPRGVYPIMMQVMNGQWAIQNDFWPQSTAVVCQKPAQNV